MTGQAQPHKVVLSVNSTVADTEAPSLIEGHDKSTRRGPALTEPVGQGKRSALLRRIRYVLRWIYWTWRHGSPKHAAWVCNYEGLWW